jgi:hypothetical protein
MKFDVTDSVGNASTYYVEPHMARQAKRVAEEESDTVNVTQLERTPPEIDVAIRQSPITNPWFDYDPTAGNLVHEQDVDMFDRFNKALEGKARADKFTLSSEHTPMPYFGSLQSKLVILGANPGLDPVNTVLEETTDRRELFDLARRHELTGNPFVFLRDEFANTPGCEWWVKRTRALREAVGDATFGSRTFTAEIHPYKSVNYRRLPKGSVFPTQMYTNELIKQAIEREAFIIFLRAREEWESLIPELANYADERKLALNSRQNSFLTPGNMPAGKFEAIAGALGSGA